MWWPAMLWAVACKTAASDPPEATVGITTATATASTASPSPVGASNWSLSASYPSLLRRSRKRLVFLPCPAGVSCRLVCVGVVGRNGLDNAERAELRELRCPSRLSTGRCVENEEADLVLRYV